MDISSFVKPRALIVPDSDFTGIINIPTPGTPVTGGNVKSHGGFVLKALTTNTNVVWVFRVGGTKASGFPLSAGQSVYVPVSALNTLAFDAEAANDKIAWMKSNGAS